jgi:hypothetical protein
MLSAASVPAAIVNWGGDEETSVEEWSAYLGELVGREVRFDQTPDTIGGIPTDNTKRRDLVGPTHVGWKCGMRRMVAALHPDLPA